MTYSQLIAAMESALAPRVSAAGGQLEIAESLEEAQKFLSAAPRSWRLILHWEGYGEHEAARQGMTSHQVATVIHAPRGLPARQSPIADRPAGSVAFSDYILAVTQWLSAMRFPSGTGADVAGFSLSNSQWLATVPHFAAHVLNWRLDAAHPPFDLTIPLSFPHLT